MGKGPWTVVLKLPDKEPIHVTTTPHHSVAMRIGQELAVKHNGLKGTRITISDQDSANQPEPGLPGKKGIILDSPKPVLERNNTMILLNRKSDDLSL